VKNGCVEAHTILHLKCTIDLDQCTLTNQWSCTNNTWTEAWYLSKYCNPAIGKVDEMVKPDVPG